MTPAAPRSPGIKRYEARVSPCPPVGWWWEDGDSCWAWLLFFPTLVPHCVQPRNFGCEQHHVLEIILFFFKLLKPFALHLIYFSWDKIGLILNISLWLGRHASIWRVFSSLASCIECSGLPLLVLPHLQLTLSPALSTLNLYPLTSRTYITGRRNVSMTCPECWPIPYFSMGGPGLGGGACQAVEE